MITEGSIADKRRSTPPPAATHTYTREAAGKKTGAMHHRCTSHTGRRNRNVCAHARTQTHAKLHPVQKIARLNVTQLCPIQLQLMLLSYSFNKKSPNTTFRCVTESFSTTSVDRLNSRNTKEDNGQPFQRDRTLTRYRRSMKLNSHRSTGQWTENIRALVCGGALACVQLTRVVDTVQQFH